MMDGEAADFRAHPAADLFPMMRDDELAELAIDIAENGLREPIALFNGMILDGRNRLRACRVAQVEPAFETLPDDLDPIAYVVSRNLRRRHLSESQRAMIAAKVATMRRGDNQHAQISATSQTEAAALFNVSRGSVQNAAAVRRDGVPELEEAVERGDLAVSAAAEIARKPEAEQREIIRRPTAAEARKQARETGRGVIARDGREYDGRTLEEERRASEETGLFFQVIDAIEALGSVPVSPADYIASLPNDPGSGRYLDELIDQNFDRATGWVTEFIRAWEDHRRGSR